MVAGDLVAALRPPWQKEHAAIRRVFSSRRSFLPTWKRV
jgi:hypothetical protein